ncbi:hypothetical protein [Micromonospora rubida]
MTGGAAAARLLHPDTALVGGDRIRARPALFLGGPTARDACWVRTAAGAFEAPVQRRSRKAGWRKNNGPVLATADFEGMLAQLDHRWEIQAADGWQEFAQVTGDFTQWIDRGRGRPARAVRLSRIFHV